MTDLREWTADQLEAAIPDAVHRCDFDAVYGLLMLMALKDPDRADLIRLTLRVGLEMAKDGAA